MEPYLQLQITGIVVLFFSSLIGYLSPFFAVGFSKEGRDSIVLKLAKSFSSGIILGVALLHLFVGANESLMELLPAYPIGFTLLTAGIVATLGLDQVTLHLFHSIHSDATSNLESRSEEEKDANIGEIISPRTPTSDHLGVDIATARALSKTALLEISIAIHSIIIGFSLGALQGTTTISFLIPVFAIHQLFEGVAIGSEVLEYPFGWCALFWFGMAFSIMVPIGILLGLFVNNQDTTSRWVASCASSLAAGSLVYTATVDMIAGDFFALDLFKKPCVKLAMFISVFFGAAVMCALAVWA